MRRSVLQQDHAKGVNKSLFFRMNGNDHTSLKDIHPVRILISNHDGKLIDKTTRNKTSSAQRQKTLQVSQGRHQRFCLLARNPLLFLHNLWVRSTSSAQMFCDQRDQKLLQTFRLYKAVRFRFKI